MTSISPSNPLDIFKSIFSLDHIDLFFDELLKLLLFVGFHLNFFFFVSFLDQSIHVVLLVFVHHFSDPDLVQLSFFVLLFLLLCLNLLFSSKYSLHFFSFSSFLKNFVLLLLFYILRVFKYLNHLLGFPFSLLFQPLLLHCSLLLKLLPYDLSMFFSLFEQGSLLCDSLISLFLGCLNLFLLRSSFGQALSLSSSILQLPILLTFFITPSKFLSSSLHSSLIFLLFPK